MEQARKENLILPLDSEHINPVSDFYGIIPSYELTSISKQLKISREDMHAVLASYGLPSSPSWCQCQAMLSVLLGTYPRVSSRIKADQRGWQAPWGPACEDLASWPLSGLEQQPALGLIDDTDPEPQDPELPMTSLEALEAMFEISEASAATDASEFMADWNSLPLEEKLRHNSVAAIFGSHLLRFRDAQRAKCSLGMIRSEVRSGSIQRFLSGEAHWLGMESL
uniref:Uncharacterized protein n=2 Tax=Cryptomonas curvata TaxID=233186 RepID=A0A7S0QLB2_9CRYP|mmetsp:Transcript_33362/g.69849  ORF Transcript_33362/g.69849 Transcript_33362/m.69849 type:complete len:224 (+) Transcript_33362:328-999(+)